MSFIQIVATAEESGVADSRGGLGVGAIALLIGVALILGWMAYLYVNSRRARASSVEATPPNMSPHASDDELENTKLTKVLRAALFGSALLAIVLPWYAFNEPGRQDDAAGAVAEADIEAGAHYFSSDGFACADCHGPSAGGGGAPFVEERSGVAVTWLVPALDDVFYRYSKDEVEYWDVYGRAGTPMPANGLAGGGAMTEHEVDQTLAWLKSIQVSQADAFARAVPAAERALSRIEGGELATQNLINKQEALIQQVENAEDELAVVKTFGEDVKDLFQAPGTCTVESAAIVAATCDDPAVDSDRDGISDAAEEQITEIAATSMETIRVMNGAAPEPEEGEDQQPDVYTFDPNPAYDVRFDPFIAFTNTDNAGNSTPDLEAAKELLTQLEGDILQLGVRQERRESFLADLEPGLEFLENALVTRPWEVDFDEVADAMDVSRDDAELAVGLFNAYCARCHTGGYSAGPAFEQGAGSGAWGPALWDGREVVQFPDIGDHIDFILTGSENAVGYGINGIGTGRMPGFGQVLSTEQIELIVQYERTL